MWLGAIINKKKLIGAKNTGKNQKWQQFDEKERRVNELEFLQYEEENFLLQ
jgi:hypothetical protein